MQKKKGMILLVLVFLTLVGVVAYDIKSEKNEALKKEVEQTLLSLKIDQIDSIQIDSKEAKKIILRRSVEGWRLESPLQEAADSAFVEDLLQEVAEAKIMSEVPLSDDAMKRFGLDQPAGGLSFFTSSGQTQTVTIASRKNFEDQVYAMVSGRNNAVLLNGAWLGKVRLPLIEFRERRILPFRAASLTKIEVRAQDQNFALSRNENNWILTSAQGSSVVSRLPQKIKLSALPLDQNQIREWITSLSEIKAVEFIDENPKSQDMTTVLSQNKIHWSGSILDVRLQNDTKEWRGQFVQGSDRDFYVLTSEPFKLFRIESMAAKKIVEIGVNSIRDRHAPFLFDKSKILAMTFQSRLKTWSLKKNEHSWAIDELDGNKFKKSDKKKLTETAQTSDSDLQPGATFDFIEKLSSAEAFEYIPQIGVPKKKDLDNVLSLKDDTKVLFEISWKTDSTGQVWMMTSAYPDVFKVKESQMNDWGMQRLFKPSSSNSKSISNDTQKK